MTANNLPGDKVLSEERSTLAESSLFDDLKNLAGKSAYYGLGHFLLSGISLLLLPLLTHYMTPADYGVLAVTGTLTAVLSILYPLSLHGALPRFYFDARNETERRQHNGTIWVGMIVAAASMTVLLDRLGDTLFPLVFREVPFVPYIRLAIWVAFFEVFSLVPLNLYQIREQAGWYVFSTVGKALLTTGLLIGLVIFWGQGAYGYLLGTLLATALIAVPFVVLTIRQVQVALRWDILKATLAYSLPLVPHGLAGWLLSLSDRVILENYVSLEQLGLYSLGYLFGLAMGMVGTAINYAWTPFMFRIDAQQGDAAKAHLAHLATYYTLVLAWIALGLALLTKDLLLIFTAPAFHQAHHIAPWAVGGLFLSSLYYIPVGFLFLKSKTGWIPLVTILSGLVNVGLNLLLVPRYGIIAAAWTTFVAYGVMLILIWVAAQRVYPFPYEYKRLNQILLAATGLLVAGNALAFPSPFIEAAVRGAVWLAFPLLLVALGFFTVAEKEKGRAFVRRAVITVGQMLRK